MRSLRWRGVVTAVLAMALCACSASPSAGVTDAGAATDGAAPVDASDTPDVGQPADAGSLGDATADATAADATAADATAADATAADATTAGAATTASLFALEPNDTLKTATALPYGGGGRGTVGGSDAADWFVVHGHHGGALRVWRLNGAVQIKTSTVGDKHYIAVTAAKSTAYALLVDFRPTAVSVTSTDPLVVGKSGVIHGQGFGDAAELVRVVIGGVLAPVISVSADKINVLVPYGAASGELRVVSGGRAANGMQVTVTAPAYPAIGYSGGVVTQTGSQRWLAGVISVRAGPTVTAEALLAAVKPLGLGASGWSPWRNRHRLSGAPTVLTDVHALAKKLMALPEVAHASAVRLDVRDNGQWATSPFYAHNAEARYRTVNLTGLHDAWKLFETLGGVAGERVRVTLFDSGLWSKQTNPCSPSFDAYPYRDDTGGFDLMLPDASGANWSRPASLGDWVDRGDTTPTVCDAGTQANPHLDGHGAKCVGVFGAVVPLAAEATHANGALTGFSRAGVDTGLPFLADVWSTRTPSGAHLSTQQLGDAMWRQELGGASVVTFSTGAVGDAALFDDPFAVSENVWVVAAGNEASPASDSWPQRYASRPNHLLVGAVQAPGDERASYSNFGPLVNIAAPTEIYTTYAGPGHFDYVAGTSSSTPLVGAMAAFVRWIRPDLHAATVVALVSGTGVDVRTRSDWHRGDTPLPRVDWMRLLTSAPIQEVLAPDVRPLLLIADRDNSGGSLHVYAIDPQTGKPVGAKKQVGLGACVGPVDVKIAPDGSRAAVTCSSSNSVSVISLHTLLVIGHVQLQGVVGSHNRTWIDPAGILHVPVVVGGGGGVALIDLYGPELIAEEKVNDDTIPWSIAPIDPDQWTGVLISSKGADAGRLTTYTPASRQRKLVGPFPQQTFAPHYKGSYPAGLALSPDGDTLTATFSGTLSDLELVDIDASGATPSITPNKSFSLKMNGTVLERPYDVVWLPNTGITGPGMTGKTLFVTSWADDRLAMLHNVGGAYPAAWQTIATFKNKTKSNPERVSTLQSGRAVFVSAWNGSVGVVTLPLNQSGSDLPYDKKIGGFVRPVGVTATPLVSIAHPRAGVRIGRHVSPTYLLRDTTAVQVTCRIERPDGTVLKSESRSPLPGATNLTPGFATCGPFDLGGEGLVFVVVEVATKHDDGTTPTYLSRRATRRLE